MNLTFEQAQPEDIPVIFAQAKCLVDTYEDIESIDYEKVLAWLQRKISEHIGEYTCVRSSEETCAYYRLCKDGELDDVYILPGHPGMGVGSRIMEKCIEESEESLFLYVFSRNIRAISFYERFGFTVREAVGKTRLILARNG